MFASLTGLVACDDAPPAKDPSKAKSDDANVVSAPNPEPGAPADGARPTSPSPGSPADGGKCKTGKPSATAKDLGTCLDSCKGMDDTVPPGSKCIPEKNSCAAQCSAKYSN